MKLEKKISLRLDLELVEWLQACADRERVPLSFVFRHLVLRFRENSVEKTGSFRKAEKEPAAFAKMEVDFQKEVCALYDGFLSSGSDEKSALSLTNLTLKGKLHPWANYEAVRTVLRGAGRFRQRF
jgi:hypothetical protein